MKLLIDTNIFYYWSGLQESKFDPVKIEIELFKYKPIYISDLSLIELCLRHNDDHLKITQIINFIIDKKIVIVNQKFIESNYYIEALKILITDLSKLDKFNESLKKQYVQNVTDFSLNIIMHIVTVFSELLIRTNDVERFNKNLYYKNIILLLNWCKEELKEIIERTIIFPRDNISSKLFIEQFKNIVLSLTQIIFDIHETIKQNIDIVKTFTDKTFKNKFNMKKKKNQMIIDLIYKDIFNECSFDNHNGKYSNESIDSYKSLLKYLSIYIQKMIIYGKRLESNDMTDMILLTYMPEYRIMTFDKKLLSIIKEITINSDYVEFIDRFRNTIL